MKAFTGRPTRMPDVLPCGCRLKNRQGSCIYTQAVRLPDGSRACKCGRRWKVTSQFTEIVEERR